MALPKLNTPKFKMKLPSDGRTVNYRPFLVKERRFFLLLLKQVIKIAW